MLREAGTGGFLWLAGLTDQRAPKFNERSYLRKWDGEWLRKATNICLCTGMSTQMHMSTCTQPNGLTKNKQQQDKAPLGSSQQWKVLFTCCKVLEMEARGLMHARRALTSTTSHPALKNASTDQKEGEKDPNYRVYHPNDVSLTGFMSKAERWITVQQCTKVCRVTTADFLWGRNQDLMFPWESFNQTRCGRTWLQPSI